MPRLSSASAEDYIEEDSEEVDELSWEDGFYDPDDWGGEEEEEEDEEEEEGDWRDELRTPEAKREYIANVLGIQPDRKNRSYVRAYNRLSDYVAGRIAEPRNPGYRNIKITAEVNRELRQKEEEEHKRKRREPVGPGNFKRGDFLGGSVSWQMLGERHRRHISGTITLEGRSLELANEGMVAKAFVVGYLEGKLS